MVQYCTVHYDMVRKLYKMTVVSMSGNVQRYWYGTVQYIIVWYCTVQYIIVWYCMVLYGTVHYGMVRYCTVHYGILRYVYNDGGDYVW